MLEILGTIGSNLLGLPGVLGLAVGMTTRNIGLASALGGIVGLVEAMLFAGLSVAHLTTVETLFSVTVGIVAGFCGSLIRRQGTTV
ncbi:MAG: hypothetical protein GKR98_12015 [Boseongicola sp.]|nr:MAG: hypothetical protein GKR98_12015 [Boseongicola sp.]